MVHHVGMTNTKITLRTAREADALALKRLAHLDSQRPLAGDVLLAEADGRPVAALSVADHRVTADPFVNTTNVVPLLRARAGQVQRLAA
jgi:hypothetical protein